MQWGESAISRAPPHPTLRIVERELGGCRMAQGNVSRNQDLRRLSDAELLNYESDIQTRLSAAAIGTDEPTKLMTVLAAISEEWHRRAVAKDSAPA